MESQPAGRPPRPTLRQVAALSGLSVKTVSRVLNGEPYVSEESATRVRTAASQLGFRLNVIASELRSGAASTIVGLLIGDLANPFWSAIARGAEKELRKSGLRLITASTDEDPALEWSLTQDMLDRRVRAILVVPSSEDHAYLDVERRQVLTVVFLDRPASNIVADTVLLDNIGGTRAAVDHLVKRGHQRIAFLGDPSRLKTHRERLAGFHDAMSRAGLDVPEEYLALETSDAGVAREAVDRLLALATPPTALFAANNWITAGALRSFTGQPASQPPALVGFDDLDLGDLLGVTVIAHDPEEMGRLAAATAVARIKGSDGPMQTIKMPTTLIARGSGERPPPGSARR